VVQQFVWANWSTKGHDNSFGNMGLQRGSTPPKDAIVYDGDLWSPYKRTRVHNQGRKFERQGDQEELYGYEADEEGELPQGAKSLHLGGLVLP
jgi:hypothetical protein